MDVLGRSVDTSVDGSCCVMLVYGWRDQTILNLVSYRFQHKNPEDVAEVPGGFVSDCNKVTDRPMCSMVQCLSPWCLSMHWLLALVHRASPFP